MVDQPKRKTDNQIFVEKTISWVQNAIINLEDAGGNADAILRMMPTDVKEMMIRNDIQLIYKDFNEKY